MCGGDSGLDEEELAGGGEEEAISGLGRGAKKGPDRRSRAILAIVMIEWTRAAQMRPAEQYWTRWR